MKKALVLTSCIAGLLTLAFTTPSFGAEEKTITGEGKCAKCSLKETDTCQNVIQTQEDGKTVTYYLAKNKVSKDFHDNICKESKKITATGTVKEADGKKELVATKIELAN
jgi:predicted nucleotidyltransferase